MRNSRLARAERMARRSCSHCPACKHRQNFLLRETDDADVVAAAIAPCSRCGRVPGGGLWLGYDPEVGDAERRA